VQAQRSEVKADVVEVTSSQPNSGSDVAPAISEQTSNFSPEAAVSQSQPVPTEFTATTRRNEELVVAPAIEQTASDLLVQPEPAVHPQTTTTTPPPLSLKGTLRNRKGDLAVASEIESAPQPLERKATSSGSDRPATDAPEAEEKAFQQPGISSSASSPQEELLSEEPGGEPLEQSLQPDPESTLPFGGAADAITSGGHQQPILVLNEETTPVTNSDRSPTLTNSEIVQTELFSLEQTLDDGLNHGENVQPDAGTTPSDVGVEPEVDVLTAVELAALLGVHYSTLTQAAALA